MTDILRNVKKPLTLDADGDYMVGSLGAGRDGTITIHLAETTCDGTITVKARASGSGAAWAAIPYRKLHLNGSVADGTEVSTGITGESLIQIRNAGGLDIGLTMASRTSGSFAVTANKAQQ